jgi:dTDP-4-dehydrorhamnose reductase
LKIALFGRTGQVATEIQRRVPEGVQVESIPRLCADFVSPEAVRGVAWDVEADVFVNAVAYTAVDQAEAEPAVAQTVNASSVGAIADVLAERGIPLLHISTDYVFDGLGERAFRPEDPTNPLCVYGRTKLAGEEAIRASGVRHIILRTSWIFSAHGANFVKTMLRLAETNASVEVVDDQVGGPTPAASIADTCLTLAAALAGGAEGGLYHYNGAPCVSWAEFAREIFAHTGLPIQVTGIPSVGFQTAAQRPLNSRLDCTRIADDFGIGRADWKAGLSDVLAELRK